MQFQTVLMVLLVFSFHSEGHLHLRRLLCRNFLRVGVRPQWFCHHRPSVPARGTLDTTTSTTTMTPENKAVTMTTTGSTENAAAERLSEVPVVTTEAATEGLTEELTTKESSTAPSTTTPETASTTQTTTAPSTTAQAPALRESAATSEPSTATTDSDDNYDIDIDDINNYVDTE